MFLPPLDSGIFLDFFAPVIRIVAFVSVCFYTVPCTNCSVWNPRNSGADEYLYSAGEGRGVFENKSWYATQRNGNRASHDEEVDRSWPTAGVFFLFSFSSQDGRIG